MRIKLKAVRQLPCPPIRVRVRTASLLAKTPILLSALAFAFITGCYARPNDVDLKRVREQFLHLRFQAALSQEYRGKSDRELFEMACRNNRVRCAPLLDMLKAQDPVFYAKLQEKPG